MSSWDTGSILNIMFVMVDASGMEQLHWFQEEHTAAFNAMQLEHIPAPVEPRPASVGLVASADLQSEQRLQFFRSSRGLAWLQAH